VADSTRVDQTLSMARANFRAPPAARERVRRGLESSGHFASGAGSQAEADAAALAARPLRAVVGVSKPAAALLAGLTFVAGYWLGGQRASVPTPAALQAAAAPPPPVTAAPSAATPEPPAPAGPAPEAPAEPGSAAPAALLPSDSSRGAARPQKPDRRKSSLAEELALLQRAEHAIRAAEPELALSFLDDLDRRHPRTRLGEERTAARLMARCARGDADVQAEAERFVRERRASVYSDRVRALCMLGTERSAPDTDRGEGD